MLRFTFTVGSNYINTQKYTQLLRNKMFSVIIYLNLNWYIILIINILTIYDCL